jgi:hypothetical protein
MLTFIDHRVQTPGGGGWIIGRLAILEAYLTNSRMLSRLSIIQLEFNLGLN